ncbi:MAG TPA: YqgE/AlgH family protein [Methylomirabilota bacterium]|nr:YqgE/AlgH family protein [Methylomirabilota bacterium]
MRSRGRRLRVPWVVVAALALAAAGPGAPPVLRAGAGGPVSLAGQLLVATEEIRDPRFHHTVIYMVRHDATGALGLVVNRPLGETPLARLLELFGAAGEGVGGSVRVHYGGPVEITRAFVLHTTDWASAETTVVGGGIGVTSHPAVLDAIARGQGPRRSLFALGYAGWAARQLEGELERGAWISVPADEALVFDDAAESKWRRATARRKIEI